VLFGADQDVLLGRFLVVLKGKKLIILVDDYLRIWGFGSVLFQNCTEFTILERLYGV
jgi:hypothetical protein